MKRPLACFGLTLFAVLLCLNLIESTAVLVSLFTLGAVSFALSFINKKSRQSLILPTFFCAVVSGCLLFSFFQYNYDNTVSYVGDNIYVTGEVAERPVFSRENCRFYCTLKVESIGENKVKTKMRLSFSETYDGINPDELQIGDKVSFIGTVYKTGSQSLSSRQYYKSHGIYLGAYSVENFEIEKPEHRPVGYYIDLLRHKISSNLMHDFDNKNASLLVALLTGDKSYMEDELYNDFIKAGIVHIMAVSGLHLSIWVAFLSFFMDFSGKKGKLTAVIMIIFTVFMMNFACFTGSVKRASAMIILYFIGKILGKKTDALNSLGFACICGLAFNPFGVLDISFMLSFLSTLGIIVMGVPLSEKIISKLNSLGEGAKKAISPFVVAFSFSVSVSFFIFPVSVLVLGGVSFAAPFSNMLCFLAVSPLLLLTGLYSLLRFVPFISPFTAVMMKYLSAYIIRVAEFMSDLPFSYINTDFQKLGIWFLTAFIFLLTAMLLYNYSRILMKASALISVGIFLLSFSVNFYASLDKCNVTVYGESKGNCAMVSLNGKGVLIGFDGDSYDAKKIAEYVKTKRVKIEGAFFTEDFIDKDKQSLCSLLNADNILTNDDEYVKLFEKVRIIKEGKNILVDASEIKTEIFYKEYLQDEDKYDTINLNDGKYVFSFRENNPYTITVIISGGEKNG